MMDFAILANYRVKIVESKKNRQILSSCRITKKIWGTWDKYLELAKEQKTMEYEGDSNPIYQPLRSGRIWHKVNF